MNHAGVAARLAHERHAFSQRERPRRAFGAVGERGCVVGGMGVNCLYLCSFLLIVHDMTMVSRHDIAAI